MTAVLVRVPGPAAFEVALGRSALEATVDRIGAVVVPITDTGRLLGKPILTVTLTRHGYRRTVVRDVDTLLPGGTAHFPVEWPDPLAGTYGIRVCASGAGLPVPVCRFNLASIAGPTVTPHQVRTGAVSAPSSKWTVVFAVVSILLALVVFALVVMMLRRRRGRARSRARHAITGYGTRVGEFGTNGNGRNARGRRGTTNGRHAGNGHTSSEESLPTTKGPS